MSFEEHTKFIEDFYHDKDVKVINNVGNGYGIIVEISGKGPGRVIGLRADFDTLPIEEEADVPFKSKNEGVMHACGHDVHTAYMLHLSEALIELKEEWSGTINMTPSLPALTSSPKPRPSSHDAWTRTIQWSYPSQIRCAWRLG